MSIPKLGKPTKSISKQDRKSEIEQKETRENNKRIYELNFKKNSITRNIINEDNNDYHTHIPHFLTLN